MHDYLIRDMVGAVSQALGIDISNSEEREKIYKALKNFWACSIVHIWGADDVIDAAGFHLAGSYVLTEEQAMEILHVVDHDLDSSVGISWQTIEDEISYYVCKNNIQPVVNDEEDE